MALTVTVLAASQNMLRLSAANDTEGEDTLAIPQTGANSLVSMCAAGPLKALFAAPLFDGPPGPGVTSWLNMIQDARLSVFALCIGANGVVGGYSFTTGGGNFLNLFTNGDGVVVFELRFEQSAIR